MGMKKLWLFECTMCLALFAGCMKTEETGIVGKEQAQPKMNKVTQRFLGTEYSKYFNYLLKDAPLVAYSLGTNHQSEEAEFRVINDLETIGERETVQGKSNIRKGWQISANGIVLTNQSEESGNIRRAKALSYEEQLYGKEVFFSFTSNDDGSAPAADGCENMELGLQVPQRIYITSPSASECNRIPMCYYSDLQVCWNSDPLNENGVVIMVEWDGTVIHEETQYEYIRSIDIVEDTGCAVLDNEMFDGMPDGALVTLTLLRGDIVVVETSGDDCPWERIVEPFIERMENDSIFADEACRIAAETHASMPMILVTELPE